MAETPPKKNYWQNSENLLKKTWFRTKLAHNDRSREVYHMAVFTGGGSNRRYWYLFGHFCGFLQITSSRWEIGWGMYGIFGKPLKRAIQTCMGHGGVGGRQKKLFSRQHGRVRVFWPVSRNFEGSGQDFDPFWVISSGFQPETLIMPWNWGKPRSGLDSAPSK